MGLNTNNAFLLEVIEWFDNAGNELVHRIPAEGSGEIKFGSQLTVRESQAAVFFYQGKAYDAFGAGRHTLKTFNIPILTKILSLPWGMTSPLRAEIYFVNMKVFTNLKWGTRDPVAFKDSQLGLIRLRAFGMYDIRIIQPVLFISTIIGTQGIYTTQDIDEYLGKIIISRFNDMLGTELDSIFNLPGRYDELSIKLKKTLQEDLSKYGLGLFNIYINSITPPQEVQKAIDDKSRLSVFDDLNKLLQLKAAESMEAAAKSQGTAGSGMGMGVGIMMPAMFANLLGKQPGNAPGDTLNCPDCKHPITNDAVFCPSCGKHLLIFKKCAGCGHDMRPESKFCSMCGAPAEQKPAPRICPGCKTENIAQSTFCNKCGEKL